MALYVYGIMRAGDAASAARPARSDDGPQLGTIEHNGVGALVSTVPDGQVRMQRNTILAHANVLQGAFEHGPVLPLRLGTVMADEEAVKGGVLAPQAEALAARLDALDGTAEMQVKAIYAEAPLLRAVLAQNPALKQAVERTRGLPAAATHFEQIRIGEAIAAAVQSRQATDGEALADTLRPLALAMRVSAPHHERAVMNAAFLVDKHELSRFDKAVEQLSSEHGSDIEFKLIGPMPPYSFADGEWQPGQVKATA